MMKVLTYEQELLDDYFISLKMPLLRRAYTIGILQEPEATMEMIRYIAETEETDLEQLSKTAAKIGRKYNWDTDDQDLPEEM